MAIQCIVYTDAIDELELERKSKLFENFDSEPNVEMY